MAAVSVVRCARGTLNASQCQVVETAAAANLPVSVDNTRTDSGTFPHPRSERRAHHLRFGQSHLARLPLKDVDEFVRTHVTFVLGPFLLRELTFGRFGGQIFDPSLKLRVRPIIQDGFGFVRQNDSQNRAS